MASAQNRHRQRYYSPFDVCRICLAQSDHRSIDVAKHSMKLVEDVDGYFGVRISGRDNKTTMLCSKCQAKITAWNELKKEVMRNEELMFGPVKKKE